MSRIAYVNGRYVPHPAASVHIEDRGYQFADGVYEVTAVKGGRLVDGAAHLDRLDRSLAELSIAAPMARAALLRVSAEMIRRNGLVDGTLYMQVTRGVARRDHPFPPAAVKPALVMTAKRWRTPATAGAAVITIPDIRWGRCDIKSVALLPNVLGKQQARAAGALEAWMVRDGTVTEGTSTNAWIVTAAGDVVTRPLGPDILGGITRQTVIRLAGQAQIRVVERPFTVAEAKAAREAFITSTTALVLPVVRIDGAAVGTGAPGPVTGRLRELYEAFMAAGAE